MRAFLARFRRQARGSVAVEFAIISPIVMMLLAGLYEMGHAFQTITAVNRLASQYAISWADCSDNPAGTCNTEMTTLYTPSGSISNIAPQLTASSTCVQMFQVAMSGTTPNVTYSGSSSVSGCASSTLSTAQTTAAQNYLTTGQNGVIVTVSYTYSVSILPGFLNGIVPSSIPINFTVVQLKA